MENSLFNKTKLDNFVRKYNNLIKITEDIRNIISKWLEKIENRKLEDEILNYGNFQDLILRQLLGYDINDISTNYQTEGNESVEFVLKKEDEAYVAIELKGSSSNIDSYRNHKNETPMQQVSRYATSQKSFKWCIVSNYDEFRLFSKNSRKEYISFRFKDLTNDTILKKFLLIFSKVSLIDNDIPSKLIIDGVNDKNFEDEFYKLFSETRFMLIKELKSFSNLNSDDAIHYAQLILNRYIFICFAEDKLLIPSNISIETITTPLKLGNLSHKKPRIWQRINELFEDIDEGRSAKNINAFNGGLFKEDLSHLIIRDYVEDDFFNECKTNWKFNKKDSDIINNLMYGKKEYINPIYYNLLFIAHFDFNTELDTNILGHIFENSIGDIEEIKKGQSNRAISERNKKGIFYTPAFITDYILKNTIIPYLSKSGNICNVDDLIKEYDVDIDSLKELDYKLKNIKILDPACGSGAFLNKATDILLEIHEKLFVKLNEKRFVNQKTSLDNFYDNIAVRRKILINNIYGVDLNQESVELTKLSMFLKVATKNMELPTLDNNIKCGNSIIDDYDIAMDKSFVWEDEFANILEEGGDLI